MDLPKRYQVAHDAVLNGLPQWKKNVVKECIANKEHNNRIYNEFCKEVISLAESEKELTLTE